MHYWGVSFKLEGRVQRALQPIDGARTSITREEKT